MNIFWILEDALRPDHMGCYGYVKPTTPNCDRLAAEGVRFETCISTASHTLPPIISMITGQNAATHGIVNPRRFDLWKNQGMWENVRTPLHTLADNGYLVDGELVMRWQPLGFTRDTPAADIEHYFRQHQQDRWFFYAEPYPTHLPYNPPEDYFRMFLDADYEFPPGSDERLSVVRSRLIVRPSGVISKLEAGEDDPIPDDDSDDAHKRTVGEADLLPEDAPAVRALYDGEARVFDDMVGRWIETLEQLGILDETLIIITADHGEELMERGHVGHCSCNLMGTLYDESIKVPLILRYPKLLPAGKVVTQQVSHIDIMPTLFDMLHLPAIPDADGSSMMPLIRGQASTFRPETYAETTPAGWQALAADKREIWCVRTEQYKLILHTDRNRPDYRRYELYDLTADPGETDNIYDRQLAAAASLQASLDEYITQARRHNG